MLRINSTLAIDQRSLAEFCRRWKGRQLSVFGSARRADFRPASDLDLMVSFSNDADWSLFDHVTMEDELSELVGRKVDLITRRAIESSTNWLRREAILKDAEPLFDAAG